MLLDAALGFSQICQYDRASIFLGYLPGIDYFHKSLRTTPHAFVVWGPVGHGEEWHMVPVSIASLTKRLLRGPYEKAVSAVDVVVLSWAPHRRP